METEGRYTLVGILVVSVVALMALAIVWLTGAADRIAYQTYTIYFQEQSLDGLAIGSPVKMRGIKVGVVAGYHFAKGGDEAVSVIARIDEGVPVHVGAAAYIKRNLVTGIAAVEIENGPAASPLLKDPPQGERYPVIAEGASDIDKVATALSQLSVNGAQVLEKMNTLMSPENQRAIGETLANLNALSAHLVANRKSLDETLAGVRDASDAFRTASETFNASAARFDANFADVSRKADATLDETRRAIDKLRQDAGAVSVQIQQLAETGTLEMTNVSRDVRTSADALTTAGQRLANPRSILFGPSTRQLGPGETLP